MRANISDFVFRWTPLFMFFQQNEKCSSGSYFCLLYFMPYKGPTFWAFSTHSFHCMLPPDTRWEKECYTLLNIYLRYSIFFLKLYYKSSTFKLVLWKHCFSYTNSRMSKCTIFIKKYFLEIKGGCWNERFLTFSQHTFQFINLNIGLKV